MKAKEFIDDDEAFKQWRERNLKGFIMNLPRRSEKDKRKLYLGAVKLHSAECHTLKSDKNGEKYWTSNAYTKVCATSATELVKWFDANVDKPTSWEPPRCKHCMPHA
jgi:hypothetical protein